jgi:hypothetical protein
MQFRRLKRREFARLMGSAAVAWPLAARAQQEGKLPTVGFLGPSTPSVSSHWAVAFVQRLHELGWVEGRNVAAEKRQGTKSRREVVGKQGRGRAVRQQGYGDLGAGQAFWRCGSTVEGRARVQLKRSGTNVAKTGDFTFCPIKQIKGLASQRTTSA